MIALKGCSSAGRASVSKTECRRFDSYRPCHFRNIGTLTVQIYYYFRYAQKVAQIFNELCLFGLTRQGATLKYRLIPSHSYV